MSVGACYRCSCHSLKQMVEYGECFATGVSEFVALCLFKNKRRKKANKENAKVSCCPCFYHLFFVKRCFITVWCLYYVHDKVENDKTSRSMCRTRLAGKCVCEVNSKNGFLHRPVEKRMSRYLSLCDDTLEHTTSKKNLILLENTVQHKKV